MMYASPLKIGRLPQLGTCPYALLQQLRRFLVRVGDMLRLVDARCNLVLQPRLCSLWVEAQSEISRSKAEAHVRSCVMSHTPRARQPRPSADAGARERGA